MDTYLFELRTSLKQLTQNLITRIDAVCERLKTDQIQHLQFWLEDLSMLTEVSMILSQNNVVDFDLDIFNEKTEILLDKVEEKDYLFVGDILQFEIKPLLSYLDGCITND